MTIRWPVLTRTLRNALSLAGRIALIVLCMPTINAAEFEYREVTANTWPTRYCYPEVKAKDLAADHYNLDRFNRYTCSGLGAGWHVDKRKADGKAICVPCPEPDLGLHQCYMKDVVVNCKLIKPGSLKRLKKY